LIPIPAPSDLKEKLLMSAAVLTCQGQYEVIIENYRSIKTLTETKVEVQTKTCVVTVTGMDLMAAYYTKEAMKITGKINKIEYIQK